jgi:hypothetical protein
MIFGEIVTSTSYGREYEGEFELNVKLGRGWESSLIE